MKTTARIRLAITLAATIGVGQIHAQSTTGTDAGSKTQTVQPQSPTESGSTNPEKAVDQAQESQDVQALDGSGVISMSAIRRAHLLVGGTVAGGFDSNPLNLGKGKSSALYSYSPYIGVQASTSRTQFLLQYHPTISRYSSYSGETMHLATAKLVGNLSPRLNWAVGVTGSHGDDSLRLLGPSQSVTVGGGSGSGSFLPNAGTVTNVDGGVDIHYDASPRDSIGLHLTNSFNSFPALHQKGSVAGANLNYSHSLKPTLNLLIYEQNSRYYGDLKCTAIGAGAGLRWQPRESTLISVKGGPQIDSPGCKSQQGFSYSTSISRKLPRRSQLFLSADRQPVISYLGSGLWQDDVSGGYERQLQSSNTLTFDVGFVHSNTLVNAAAYHGTFFDASYTRQLHRGLALAWSYRTFTGSSGGTGIDRNMLQFALTFSPNTRTLSQ